MKDGNPSDFRHVTPSSRTRPTKRERPLVYRNRRETGRYVFHDSAGIVVATKIRYDFDNEDGTPGKTFVMKPAGVAVPLYRFPCVLSAAKQGWEVWLAEGERKSDLLELYIREEWGIDAAATSFAHWKPSFAEYFRGASLAVLMPDRDDAGQRKARAVADDLRGIVPVVVRPWEEPA